MAERRKVRSSTGGGTSTRSREPADRDEQEMLESESMDADQDELLDADEAEATDDEILDADEPDDEILDADEPDDEILDDEPEAPEPGYESRGNVQRSGRRRPDRRGGSGMTAGEAAQAALREIAQLTAKQPEGVTEVARTDDGWTVGIELVEDQRIPSSADILATYETTIDADGELVSYRRVRRYARGRGDTEEI